MPKYFSRALDALVSLALAAMFFGLTGAAGIGCAGTQTLRHRAWDVSNGVAVAANAGGDLFIASVCAQQMRAIGRAGRLDGERCVESGPRAGTPATDAERVQLARLRETHSAIVTAYQRLRGAHRIVMEALRAADDAHGARLFEALAHLTVAYSELATLAEGADIELPDLLPALERSR